VEVAQGFQNQGVGAAPTQETSPDQPYCQAVTYLRCSVTDCARNAFNDVMCGSESTSVLNCRIVDVGGCSWEGASRFVKFTGNYIRNAGIVGIGNLGPANRDATFPELGSGQHIIADNVFDGNTCYGGCAIRSSRGATQVIIRNNLFINFASSGVEVGGAGFANEFPSSNTTITGNIFDMTVVGPKALARTAITVAADDTIVSDNQIYVRGGSDATLTGIRLREPARNALVHNNLLRNCGAGIVSTVAHAGVGVLVDDTTFVAKGGNVPNSWRPEGFRGWPLDWIREGKVVGSSVVDSFDPITLRVQLKQAYEMKVGDQFEIYPRSANWNIHDNTLSGCLSSVVLDSHGSATSLLRDNQISQPATVSGKPAIQIVRGQFELIGNRITEE
jgi:hypothetical protein